MNEYYKILWLNIDASMEEIIDAYTRLAVKNNPTNWWSEYLFKIILFAYNEIIINYWNRNKDKELLLEAYKINENIINWDIEYSLYIPEPEEICNDIYQAFYMYKSNPFIKDENYNTKSIIEYYNSLQLKKEESKRSPFVEYSNIADRSLILSDEACPIRTDLLQSKTLPWVNICLLICQLYNYDIYNYQAKNKIKVLLTKAVARDLIAVNWWMILNDEK